MYELLETKHCWIVAQTEKLTIGRDPACDIMITDREVSRFHAIIFWENSRCWIADLDSRNGTFVDKQRVKLKTHLLRGDLIQIASCFTLYVKFTNEGAVLQRIKD